MHVLMVSVVPVLRGKKGVSVILGTILLLLIAIGATTILYSLYAPQLVPSVDTNRMLEEISIASFNIKDIGSGLYNITLHILNKGSVDVTIDRIYVEDLLGNWEASSGSVSTPVMVKGSNLTYFTVLGIFNTNDTKVIKAVTQRGTAAEVLYAPTTGVSPEEVTKGGSGSNITQFTITVYKFNDANINGVYDPGESLIEGWPFYLWDANRMTPLPIANTLTGAQGYCTFQNLNKGRYLVVEQAERWDGSTFWFNSTASSYPVEINSQNVTIYVGDYPVKWEYNMSGYVFKDVTPPPPNGNGIWDAGDSGLGGWTVTYYRLTGLPVFGQTKTQSDGSYSFTGLANGMYVVAAWQADPLEIWIPTSPNPNVTTIVNQSTQMNFSFYQVSSSVSEYYYLSGLVFNDTPVGGNLPDGVYNPIQGDSGIANITLLVYNGSVPVTSNMTNASGLFSIPLRPGIYTIEVQPNWNDWDPTTPSSYVVDLTSSNQSRQFGLYYNPLGSVPLYIAGMVFNDTNGDGEWNSTTEVGIPNISVFRNDTPSAIFVTTDASGNFTFDNQAKGNYTVFLDNATMQLQLPGYIITTDSSVDISLANTPIVGIKFGVYRVGVVYGWVYYNNDSIPGFNPATDYPLKDVTILLNGTRSARTDANGLYFFDSLTPGYYEVQQIPLDGWNCTSQRVVVGNNFAAPLVVNFTNNPLPTLKFNITGTLFNDDDRDGVNDIAYPGGDSPHTTSRTVRIRYASNGTVISSVSTSSTTGMYTFTNLAAGVDYIVYMDNYPGYTFTTPQSVLIKNLISNQTVDFGIYLTTGSVTYTVSGVKYNDTAPYGVYNPGDARLTNWTIYLYSGTDISALPLQQNSTFNGNFFFDNLAPGTYTLVELVRPGWANMTPSIVTFSLTDHKVVDFYNNYTAFRQGTTLYSISGYIFNDTDNSGTYNLGDTVIANSLVILYDNNSFPIDAVRSNSSGIYAFANLAGGNYSLVAQIPSGYTNTTPTYRPVLNLSSNITINFGFRQPATPITYTVDGYVWRDTNKNQVYDRTESPMSGWTLYLYAGTYSPYFGNSWPPPIPIASTTTNSSGYYYFAGLGNTTYTVVSRQTIGSTSYTNTTPRMVAFTISGAPYVNASFGVDTVSLQTTRYISGFKFNDSDNSGSYTVGETKLNNWTIWLNDGDGFPIRSVTSNTLYDGERYFNFTTLPNGNYVVYEQLTNQAWWTNTTPGVVNVTIAGSSNSSITFGNRLQTTPSTYLISGYVYNDTNRNDKFDDGNAVMTDAWTIFLYSGSYSPYTFPTAITTTTSGQYNFTNLGNGTYTVVEVLKANYTSLWPRSVTVTISGASMTNQSFFNKWTGTQPTYLVYGYKYNDTDRNGAWDQSIGDEAALPNWQINLYDSFGFPLGNAVTSSSGYYSFLVPNGAYTVAENLANQSGWTFVGDYKKDITVSGAPVRCDFGNYQIGRVPAYSIYGWVFNDTNSNGIQEAGEVGLSGWTVRLMNGTTGSTIATTSTNGSGFYIFPNRSPGYYRVNSTNSAGFTNTTAYLAYVTTTTQDQVQNFSWYYSYTPPVPITISGRVYNQVIGNGLAGWTVVVNNGTYINSKLTDSTGNYSFTLSNGTYTVQAIVMSGYYNITPSTVTVTLAGAGQVVDFGMNLSSLLPRYTVSGLKFDDLNKNGIQDGGEVGIANWGFILYNATDLLTAFTNSSGIFEFNGLLAGTYTLNETYRGGWANSTPTSISVPLSANGTFLKFGNYLTFAPGQNFSISGYVFNDLNRNSAFDGPDSPLSGWLMTLSDYQGTIIDSQLTDATGKYNFSSLAGGNYTVTSWYSSGAGWKNVTASVVVRQIINESITNLNFGYIYDRYNVSGYVYFNATTAFYPLNGWQVVLRNELGDIQVANTASNGYYEFANQPPGTYNISIVMQSGWNATNGTSSTFTITNASVTRDFSNKRWFFGQFLTYDRNSWSTGANNYLVNNITDIYGPSWVISIGDNAAFRNQWNNISFITGSSSYLTTGLVPGTLTQDWNNPNGASPGQGGMLGANILALKFNIDFDRADFGLFDFGPSETLLENLRLYGYTGPMSIVNGKTIGEIFADANRYLGTNSSSLGLNATGFNDLIARINSAFLPSNAPGYSDAHSFIY